MEEFKFVVSSSFFKKIFVFFSFLYAHCIAQILPFNSSILSMRKDIEAEFVKSDVSPITVPQFLLLLFAKEVFSPILSVHRDIEAKSMISNISPATVPLLQLEHFSPPCPQNLQPETAQTQEGIA